MSFQLINSRERSKFAIHIKGEEKITSARRQQVLQTQHSPRNDKSLEVGMHMNQPTGKMDYQQKIKKLMEKFCNQKHISVTCSEEKSYRQIF